MLDKGAHFHRCDFQVHTPRDPQWRGPRPTDSGGRSEWAHSLVAACRTKMLDAIAITDHHDLTMFPFVRQAAHSELDANGEQLPETKQLVVFPGLELTLGVPCQALLLFDAHLPVERLNDIMASLSIERIDPDEPSLPSTEPLEHIESLQDIYDRLDEHAGLRGRYIVLPNVTDGGRGTLMRQGMSAKYRQMPCVGGYLDGSAANNVGIGNRNIFDGDDSNWGNKRIGLIQTSDSRSSDYQTLGEPSTWIKWAEPTAEAIRQACLAQESRISHASPSVPTVYLTNLTVTNSKFLGRIQQALNPQYNAVIGGRGTGKSTILDYIRWALCDQPPTEPEVDEIGDPRARQSRLVEATLTPVAGSVDVHFILNDIPHTVRRSAAEGSVQLKIGTDPFQEVREDYIRELLPVQAYSQKQLSSVSVKVDELTRLVTSPIRKRLANVDHEIDGVVQSIREVWSSTQRYRQLKGELDETRLRERSLSQQAQNLRDSLEGLSDADRRVLNEKGGYDQDETQYKEWKRIAERADEAGRHLEIVLENLLRDLSPGPTDREDQLGQSLRDYRDRVHRYLKEYAGRVSSARQGFATADVLEDPGLEARFDDFRWRYDEVKTRSSAHENRLQQLSELEGELARARDRISELAAEVEGLGHPEEDLARTLDEQLRLMRERSVMLEEQCDNISALSEGLVRAGLKRAVGLGGLSEALRGVVTGSGLRSAKLDEFFTNLINEEDPLETWRSCLDDLDTLVMTEADTSVTTEMFPVLARLGFSTNDLGRLVGHLGPDAWLSIAITKITDHPTFEYQTGEGDYIDFSVASAGQQATALIRILLAQSGPPLVIDQPEDDLDSQIVLRVVQQIWESKTRRQLVFASHNANFVVNGDAELVACCDYQRLGDQSGGQIKMEGAIDVQDVREEITTVMEGGKRAFKLRKDKYGF